jgi:hypothetical protein
LVDQWYAVSVQKSASSDIVRVYLNGSLRITETVGDPLPTLDQLRFRTSGTGIPIIREISARTNTVLPEIPFGPGGVHFGIGDPQLRWNSYML